jgi:predicted ArsR family transcriptional regulator
MRIDTDLLPAARGRILDLLRRGGRTVDELAAELGVTDNAVRPHLAALEQAGIVQASGVRREGGVGKPATIYDIAPDAEPRFSAAYAPVLEALLGVLGERLDERELRAIMRDVGHRLAGEESSDRGSLHARAEGASSLLNQLGGVTTVHAADGDSAAVVIQGCGCPLSVAVAKRAETCLAVQTMLSDIFGVSVREKCDRSDRPRCCFELRRSA